MKWLPRARCRSTVDGRGLEPCACGTRTIASFKNVLEYPARVYDTGRVLIIAYDSYKQTYLCTAVSYDTLGTATAPVSACLQPTRCLAARNARGISQAGRHTSSKRRYIRVHNTKQDEKNAVFRRNIHEVGETVLFRQYVPVALLLLWILLVLGALYCQSHTDIFTSMSTYKGTICVSKRTHRHSHEACMNVLSVEQYQTTYCRLG